MSTQGVDCHNGNLRHPGQQDTRIPAAQYLRACFFASVSAAILTPILLPGMFAWAEYQESQRFLLPRFFYSGIDSIIVSSLRISFLAGIISLLVNIILGIPTLLLLRLLRADYVLVATAAGIISGCLMALILQESWPQIVFLGLLGGVCGMVASYSVWGNRRKRSGDAVSHPESSQNSRESPEISPGDRMIRSDMDPEDSHRPRNWTKAPISLAILITLNLWLVYRIHGLESATMGTDYCLAEKRSMYSLVEDSLGLLQASWVGMSESEVRDAIASNTEDKSMVKEGEPGKSFIVEGLEFTVSDGEIVSIREADD